MGKEDRDAIVAKLLADYGRTFADELGIEVERNTPGPLFQLLCAALLYSARIPIANATRAMRALLDAGLTTPQKMAAASWQDRVEILTSHGYKRYDERSSTQLGDAARRVQERYDGDLRELREAADRDVAQERRLLTQFKGIGDVGANIFLREVQLAWDEVFPYTDERVLDTARRLGLGERVGELTELVPRARFPELVAALIRAEHSGKLDELRAPARG